MLHPAAEVAGAGADAAGAQGDHLGVDSACSKGSRQRIRYPFTGGVPGGRAVQDQYLLHP